MTASRGGSPSGRCGESSRCTGQMVGNPWHARPVSDLTDLRVRMRSFTAERDWDRFHDPKSLLLALVGEIGELAELFQWLPADTAAVAAAQDPLKTRAAEELADVLLYLVRLADVLDVDLHAAAISKLVAAEGRFDPAVVRGVAPDRGQRS